MVAHPDEFASPESAVKHRIRHELVARLVGIQGEALGLRIEPGAHKSLCHDIDGLGSGIWIE